MTATTAPQTPADPAAEPIRPAATVILWRDGAQGREILMGQRGAGAVFMPSKYVFPGGAVDPQDQAGAPVSLGADCLERLALRCPDSAPNAQTLARLHRTRHVFDDDRAHRALVAPDIHEGGIGQGLACEGLRQIAQHGVFG